MPCRSHVVAHGFASVDNPTQSGTRNGAEKRARFLDRTINAACAKTSRIAVPIVAALQKRGLETWPLFGTSSGTASQRIVD